MAGGGALGALLGKALAARDPLALRIVRNLAERAAPADAAAAFAPAADALARLLTARASAPAGLNLVAMADEPCPCTEGTGGQQTMLAQAGAHCMRPKLSGLCKALHFCMQ